MCIVYSVTQFNALPIKILTSETAWKLFYKQLPIIFSRTSNLLQVH